MFIVAGIVASVWWVAYVIQFVGKAWYVFPLCITIPIVLIALGIVIQEKRWKLRRQS